MKVAHQRRDDLVGTGAKPARYPGQSAQSAPPAMPARKVAGMHEGGRCAAEHIGDEGGADGAHIELALRTDIEEAAAERDRDAGRGDEERERPAQALRPAARAQEGALDDAFEHQEGGVAGELEDDATERESDHNEGERADHRARADADAAHADAPVMARPTAAMS